MTTAAAIDVRERFLAAVDCHRKGDVAGAESQYRAIVAANPRHADAMHLWGVARQQQGRSLEAVAAMRRSLMLNPTSVTSLQNLAGAYRSLGRLDRAADCYREAMRLAPNRPQIPLQLADVLRSQGQREQAIELCRAVVEREPQSSRAHQLLGDLLQELDRNDEAAGAYRRALELDPGSTEILNNLGRALHELGRVEEAISLYEDALRQRPACGSILMNLGSALRSRGDLAQAIAVFLKAAGASADDPAVHHNLANAWKEAGDTEQAETAYRRAIGLEPRFAEAHGGLAALLEQDGDCVGASLHLARAIEINPKARWRIRAATLLPPIYASHAELLTRRAAMIESVRSLIAAGVRLDASAEPAILNFYLPYQGFNERELQSQLARLAAPSKTVAVDGRSRPRRRRIRVGFLSRHLHEHTIGRLFKNVIAGLTHERFEVTVIAVGPKDDALSRFLRSAVERYVTIGDQIPAALELVAGLGLDVLCYPDLGMEPVSWTLAHSRLAPIQCALWGHPLTTGLPTIDYFLSSRLFEPADADEHYSERLVRFASLGTHYDRPDSIGHQRSRADWGWPDDRHVYGCPQSLFKIHPDFDAILGEILRRDDRATIVLLSGSRPSWERRLRERFKRTIGADADASRIMFAPRGGRADFLSLVNAFDVMLDPVHFGGGNTSLEALSLGIPIVTWPSKFLRGRITGGLYERMGLVDCVASDAESYVRQAVQLACDADYRRHVHLGLRERSSVLFEDEAAIRDMESFLESAVECHSPS